MSIKAVILEKARQTAGFLLDLMSGDVEAAKALLDEEGAKRAEKAADVAEAAKFGG